MLRTGIGQVAATAVLSFIDKESFTFAKDDVVIGGLHPTDVTRMFQSRFRPVRSRNHTTVPMYKSSISNNSD